MDQKKTKPIYMHSNHYHFAFTSPPLLSSKKAKELRSKKNEMYPYPKSCAPQPFLPSSLRLSHHCIHYPSARITQPPPFFKNLSSNGPLSQSPATPKLSEPGSPARSSSKPRAHPLKLVFLSYDGRQRLGSCRRVGLSAS